MCFICVLCLFLFFVMLNVVFSFLKYSSSFVLCITKFNSYMNISLLKKYSDVYCYL